MSRNRYSSPLPAVAAERAERSEGIVDRDELLGLGLTRHQVDRWLRDGHLHQLYEGVFALGHRSITRRGRRIAALRSAGPDALLCGFSGGAVRGMSVREGWDVHVCVPPTGRRSRCGLRVHAASLEPDEHGHCDGLPVVSLPRLLVELAAVVSLVKLNVLVAEAAHKGMSAAALDRQLDRSAGQRGIRSLRLASDGYRGGQPTRSVPEASFVQLCRRFSIPDPCVNVPIGDREVDFFWPAYGLIVEIDGFGPHRHRERFEGDRERAVELAGGGVRVPAVHTASGCRSSRLGREERSGRDRATVFCLSALIETEHSPL